MTKGETGKRGEMAAANFLRKNGYEIRTANFRTRMGEIDIIATIKKYIVFVEVKTRAVNSMVLPREAVVYSKQKKIKLAAEQYLAQSATGLQPRFDVIEIYIKKGERFAVDHIAHIPNAF